MKWLDNLKDASRRKKARDFAQELSNQFFLSPMCSDYENLFAQVRPLIDEMKTVMPYGVTERGKKLPESQTPELYWLKNPNDEMAVSSALQNIVVDVKHNNGDQITILNGVDVSSDIRTSAVSDICSITSPYPKCREFVLNIQRDIASKTDLIMEGRDITSHVLPNADFKFFLDASIDVRANRRYQELLKKGEKITFNEVKLDLIERDRRDTQRENCPLILTEGTIHIDNSAMTIDEEVELMYNIIKGEVK